MPFPVSTKTRERGKPLDVTGYHLLTFETGGGPVWTHNSVRGFRMVRMPNSNSSAAQSRTKRPLLQLNARPDIAICNAAWLEGAAALRREEKKIDKYKYK